MGGIKKKSAPSNGVTSRQGYTSADPVKERRTPEEDRFADFAFGKSNDMYASRNYSNGNMFNCTWRENNIVYENGVMALVLSQGKKGYDAAENRSWWEHFHYGFYSVSMKAAKCSGVVSAFFLYTGYPSWDEIDIEFLGRDTTKVQFNYYTNGEGGHEYIYDLGFDASEGFHEYAFEWTEEYIEWYVDGFSVHKATKDIPTHEMRIFTNIWTGKGESFVNWCGELDSEKLPLQAEYEWIGYKAD